MMLVPFALCLVAQNLEDTKGKTNAQILAMGRSRWHEFYVGKDAGITASESSAEGLYGDALAWRNDKLLKGRPSPLRKALIAFGSDAAGAGAAVTGGGTMWNITSASLYADGEETFYAVLARKGKAPHRKVSDAEKAVAKLKAGVLAIGADRGEDRKHGLSSIAALEKDLRSLVALAAKLPRAGSDEVLEFCRSTAAAVAEQAEPL